MNENRRGSLKGITFEELKRTITISGSPAAFVQDRRTSGLSERISNLQLEDGHILTPPSSRSHNFTPAPLSGEFNFSFPHDHNNHSPFTFAERFNISHQDSRPFESSFGSRTLDQKSSASAAQLAGEIPQSPSNMDNSQSKLPSSPKVIQDDHEKQSVPSPRPIFGRPTQLGASVQPFARHQLSSKSSSTDSNRPFAGREPAGNNHLFIKNVSGNRRPDGYRHQTDLNPLQSFHKPYTNANHTPSLHKPPPGGNPLSQMYASSKNPSNSDSRNPSNSTRLRPTRVIDSSDDDDDDVFEIPKPTGGQSWQPKPFAHPTFSSSQITNPCFQAKPTSTTIMSKNTLATNTVTDGGIWEDRYNAADPSIYLDSGKANEELKALFEGSVEDEDDKPRTRRRNNQIETKLGNLSGQIKSLSVNGDRKEQPDEAGEEEEDDGTVEGLKVKLLPHQIEGVEWMRTKERGKAKGKGMTKGGILADDMGLGKTIQSIALLLTNQPPEVSQPTSDTEVKYDKCTLIVAPLALIKQWEGELKDRVESSHSFKICVHHGPNRAKSYKELRKYDIVITTYQTLSSEHAACSKTIRAGCFGVNWYRVILDEAHTIKNRSAKVTKAACELEAKYRWCLTGTPMQNNLDELQSLIHFLQIGPLDKFEYWKSRIIQPINSGRGGLAIQRLRAALRPIMKRRTKDVLKQSGAIRDGTAGDSEKPNDSGFKIVKRTVEKVEAEFTREERAFYSRLESRIDQNLERMMAGEKKMNYASALVLLLRLRQACNHVKLLGFDLAGERDALGDGMQSPRKKTGNDVDDLTAMLGGLNVEMKQCDICQGDLSKEEVEDGALRCRECEEDLYQQVNVWKPKQQKKKFTKAIVKNDRKIKRKVIIDSDDDEDEDEDEVQPGSNSRSVKLEDSEDDNNNGQDKTDEDEDGDESEDDNDSSSPAAAKLVASTKIRHLLSILRNDSHTHKYIVFSFFTSMLDLIEPFLQQSHIKFTRYDGSMRNDAREASLNALRNDPTTRVLLCSLRAGSLGLNLTAASRVVVLEPFWNPFVEEQAIDRVHRLNQTQDVVVYKLTVKDTVEARILELQEKKRELARVTVEGGAGAKGVAKLTLAEMMKLFEHTTEQDAMVDMFAMKDGKSLLDRERGESTEEQGRDGGFEVRDGLFDRGKDRRRKEHEVYGRRW